MAWNANAYIRTTYAWNKISTGIDGPGRPQGRPRSKRTGFVSTTVGNNRLVNPDEGQPKLNEFC